VLQQPLLDLSLFIKQHRISRFNPLGRPTSFSPDNRSLYDELLDRVRQQGGWEAWLTFFLEGVGTTASAAVAAALRLLELSRRDAKGTFFRRCNPAKPHRRCRGNLTLLCAAGPAHPGPWSG
jgi:hypothetical protein